MKSRIVVVKLGGSLFEQRQLIKRLKRLVDSLGTRKVLIIPGGGVHIEPIRKQYETDLISEDDAHWRCISRMGEMAQRFSKQYPYAICVTSQKHMESAWKQGKLPWYDVGGFLRRDDKKIDRLPHSWGISSDSIAAHVATRFDADLVLLKACPLPRRSITWNSYARRGIVDTWFPRIADRVKSIRIMNLPE